MSTLHSIAHHLLNNQPNEVIIGYSKQEFKNIATIPFHHLSRNQQIEQIIEMFNCGISLKELQKELYLVAHKQTQQVWKDFGVLFLD